MTNESALFFRCTSPMPGWDFAAGDVYPAWREQDGSVVLALDKDSKATFQRQHRDSLETHFVAATAEEFEESIQRAMREVDAIRLGPRQLLSDVGSFNTELLGAGEATEPAESSGPASGILALHKASPADRIRNAAHGCLPLK